MLKVDYNRTEKSNYHGYVYLERLIDEGKLVDGDIIPSAKEIAEAAKITVKKAAVGIKILKMEGRAKKNDKGERTDHSAKRLILTTPEIVQMNSGLTGIRNFLTSPHWQIVGRSIDGDIGYMLLKDSICYCYLETGGKQYTEVAKILDEAESGTLTFGLPTKDMSNKVNFFWDQMLIVIDLIQGQQKIRAHIRSDLVNICI